MVMKWLPGSGLLERDPLDSILWLSSVSVSKRNLRSFRKVECFSRTLVSGHPYILPLLVASDSPGAGSRTPVTSGIGMSHVGLPYLVWLGVGKHQTWNSFFCWVGGCKSLQPCSPSSLGITWLVSFLLPTIQSSLFDASCVIL